MSPAGDTEAEDVFLVMRGDDFVADADTMIEAVAIDADLTSSADRS